MPYRVKTSTLYWMFINHPERLKFYWTTTGTRSYWPGRTDNLMTDSGGIKKYYLTRPDSVSGTPAERIQQLMEHHYISGQRTAIMEVIEGLVCLMDKKTPEYTDIIRLLEQHIDPEQKWIMKRIKNAKHTRNHSRSPGQTTSTTA